MTVKGKTNHYNVKLLKGYGFSIKVKNSKIVLKNRSDQFKETEIEEWYVNNMPGGKIVMIGKDLREHCRWKEGRFQEWNENYRWIKECAGNNYCQDCSSKLGRILHI